MWARASAYQFPVDDVDGAVERFEEALGELEDPGLARAELLVDRASGKALTITVWESPESLDASVAAADRLRSSAADAAGGSILDVSHYEIVSVVS